MPNKLFDNFRMMASKKIKAYGTTLQLVSSTSTGTEWNPVNTETETNINAVILQYKPHEIDGEQVQFYDIKVITDSEVKPETDMKLKIKGAYYSIINTESVMPDGDAIIYRIQARR